MTTYALSHQYFWKSIDELTVYTLKKVSLRPFVFPKFLKYLIYLPLLILPRQIPRKHLPFTLQPNRVYTNLVALNLYLWLVKISLSCKKYNISIAFFEIFKENIKFTVYSQFFNLRKRN